MYVNVRYVQVHCTRTHIPKAHLHSITVDEKAAAPFLLKSRCFVGNALYTILYIYIET